MSGIDMEPPAKVTCKMKPPSYKTLLTRDTGMTLIFDKEDFELVKHVIWYELKGKIVNSVGVSIEKYLNLPKNRSELAGKYDFRRKFYSN